MTLRDGCAIVLTILGLIAGAIAAPLGGRKAAIAAVLDFWTAAGLLRISEDKGFSALAVAALLVLSRKLVGVGLHFGRLASARGG